MLRNRFSVSEMDKDVMSDGLKNLSKNSNKINFYL